MKCNSINISLCIALLLLLGSVILEILYLAYIDMGIADNKFGEISLYLFAISFLACILRTGIKDEEKKPRRSVVTPL
jgi:hypothetical protein